MFFTGVFSRNGNTIQKSHDTEFNDDVLSWYSESDRCLFEAAFSPEDGYVTNNSSEVTIHIKPEANTDETINFVKVIFGLNEKNGVSRVFVEEL